MELRDRVAIITGGGGGIGSATARHWLAEGARHIVVADYNADAAAAVADELGCEGVGLALATGRHWVRRVRRRARTDVVP